VRNLIFPKLKLLSTLIAIFGFLYSCSKSEYKSLTNSYNPTTSSQNLDDWIQIGGSWTISADGTTASQNSHGGNKPFFLVSSDSYSNILLEGTVTVTGSDDDFIGWVFGLSNPTNTSDTTYKFILIDWKKETSGGGQEGSALAKVNGSFSSGSADINNHFFQRADTGSSGKFYVLNTNYGNSEGWVKNTNHTFKHYYTENKIKIIIDDETIFEETGEFTSGKVGLYMFSQNDASFSNISITTGFDPSGI
tara:strand:+ start:86 stop:832 length:747 start_codon:yes stop_codon:yes gene_type:complete